jgi:two-component system, LytTR family, response regulator
LKQTIRTLIVDDEPLARDAIRILLQDDADIEIISDCSNGVEAVKMILKYAPDLVFLDVQMPDLDGFQVIEQVGADKMPVTVFVTAYDQYALRAFIAHALDYILKPFDHERFYDALQRAKSQVLRQKFYDQSHRLLTLLEDLHGAPQATGKEEKEPLPRQKFLDRLVIKADARIFFLQVEEIDWIEADGDYMILHSGSKSHLLRETMNELATKLDPEKFLRISRSSIVNVERIKDIKPFFKGEHILTLKDGKQLKMTRGYRDKLQALLGQQL